MQKLLNDILSRVSDGQTFNLDLRSRTIRVGTQTLLKDGDTTGLKPLPGITREQALEQLDGLYAVYKHSIPSERSESRRFNYFKALDVNELDPDDLLYGEAREKARAELETTLLLRVLDGTLTWDAATMGTWFWKSKTDRDFVILKDWIS